MPPFVGIWRMAILGSATAEWTDTLLGLGQAPPCIGLATSGFIEVSRGLIFSKTRRACQGIKTRAGAGVLAPALVRCFVCYVVRSRDLLVVAEAPVIIVVEAPVIVAEVVIVAVAVIVAVEVVIVAVDVVEVYVVYDKDRIVEEVVLLNRVTEDASGNPDALREARATPLVVPRRRLRYPQNFIKTIVEVIVVAAVPLITVVPAKVVPVVPLIGHGGTGAKGEHRRHYDAQRNNKLYASHTDATSYYLLSGARLSHRPHLL